MKQYGSTPARFGELIPEWYFSLSVFFRDLIKLAYWWKVWRESAREFSNGNSLEKSSKREFFAANWFVFA